MENERERLEKEAARQNRHSVKRYLIAFLIGAVLTLAFGWIQDVYTCTDTLLLYKRLSNALFAAGVLLTGIGLLTVVSAGGFFDILVYGFQLSMSIFKKDPLERKTAKNLYEYKQAKGERYGLWFLVFTGLLYLAAATVFTILFLSA